MTAAEELTRAVGDISYACDLLSNARECLTTLLPPSQAQHITRELLEVHTALVGVLDDLKA